MPGVLAPDDRTHVCKVAVDEQYGSPSLRQNPLSNPVTGAVAGAGQGAVYGIGGGGMGMLISAPLGAIVGGIYGGICAAANQSHPDAEADFERLLHEAASAGSLKQSLETDLNLPRSGCARPQGYGTASAAPDTIVEIQRVDVGMGCAFGKQEYWIFVTWRAINAENRKVLGEKTTRCSQISFRDVDAWFADPDRARDEIERVLAKTGRRMAEEILSPGGMSACQFRSLESGEIEAR